MLKKGVTDSLNKIIFFYKIVVFIIMWNVIINSGISITIYDLIHFFYYKIINVTYPIS